MGNRLLPAFLALAALGVSLWAQEDDPVIEDKPLSQLTKQLQSENRGLQLRAAQALSKVSGDSVAKIVPRLIPLLRSARENDRFVAAQTLGNYGPPARAAVPELIPLLQGTQFERNRAAAAKALGQILENAQPCEEVEKVALALTAKFNEDYDKYSDVRREAVRALGMIGPAAKVCIPKLTRGLTDFVLHSQEHFLVRQQSAWTCGRMGPLAVEHVDRLISMLHAEGCRAPEIVEALGRIGAVNDNVVSNIVDVLERRDGGITWQLQAYVALRNFGPKSAPAVQLLVRFLKERLLHPHLTVEVFRVMKAIGPGAKEAIPVLETFYGIKEYRSRDQNFRATTAEELADMRKLSREAVEAIRGSSSDSKEPAQK